jgi:hypothetical protein
MKSKLTVDMIARKIIVDLVNCETNNAPKKYGFAAEIVDSDNLMETLMPNDKVLGDCTGAEVAMIGQAYEKVSKMKIFASSPCA